jgi:hypothetical protein
MRHRRGQPNPSEATVNDTLRRLLDEADANVREQRDRAVTLTNKATALLGFTAVAIPLLWRAVRMTSWSFAAVVVAGASLMSGFYVVIGRKTTVGPRMVEIHELALVPVDRLFAALLLAKENAYRANAKRLASVETAWMIHITMFVAAGILALLHARSL